MDRHEGTVWAQLVYGEIKRDVTEWREDGINPQGYWLLLCGSVGVKKEVCMIDRLYQYKIYTYKNERGELTKSNVCL